MAPKKKARTESASWQYEGDDGWEQFPDADMTLLEKEYTSKGPVGVLNTTALTFNKGYTTTYTFNFGAMTQRNQDSGKERKIRRVAPLSECQWEWKDDSGLFVPFYDDDSVEIERLFALYGTGTTQKTKNLSFNKGYDSMYAFTFTTTASTDATPAATTGTQKNEDSGKVRELRRIQKKLPWSIEGFGISGKVLPTLAEAAAALAAAAAPTVPAVASAAPTAPATVLAPAAAATEPAAAAPQLARASTLSLPAHWTSKGCAFDASGNYNAVPVAAASEEFNAIGGAVASTVGKKVTVTKVVRIENVTLWTFYAMTRAHISKRNGDNPNERLVFYGERSAANIKTIHKFGFDTRVAEDGNFGIGLYFGVHASFCDSGRCLQNPDGSKEVLVCRAALGASAKGAKTIRRPPPKDPKKPTMDLFDSCCDDKDPASLYVLFNNSQAYPEYIVTYV